MLEDASQRARISSLKVEERAGEEATNGVSPQGLSVASDKDKKSVGKCGEGFSEDELKVWRRNTRSKLGLGRKTLNPPVPLAAFNVALAIVCLCVFLAFLVEIVREYVEALADPPVGLGLSLENPRFPTILVCNGMSSVEITAMDVCALDFTRDAEICCNATSNNGFAVDKSCLIKFEVISVTSLRPGQENMTSTCARMAVPSFLGFAETFGWLVQNTLQLKIDVTKKQSVSPSEVRSLMLFTMNSNAWDDQLVPNFLFELLFLAATGYTFLEPYRLSILSLELEISKTVDGTTSERYNIQQASARFEERSANHTEYDVTIGFGSDRIRTFTETRPSFATAFGSAAGWLGALSDGWGCLSIVFILEKVFLLCLGRRPAWEE